MKALKTRLRLPRWLKDESGVAMFEYAIALPVYMMLVFFAVAICWFWWQQNIAVVALHEGTNLDAIHGGGVYGLPPSGTERTKAILIAALGASAPGLSHGVSDQSREWRAQRQRESFPAPYVEHPTPGLVPVHGVRAELAKGLAVLWRSTHSRPEGRMGMMCRSDVLSIGLSME